MKKLYIVGIGPGDCKYLTLKAYEVLKNCDYIIGYKRYIKHLREILDESKLIESDMGEEIKRVKLAIDLVKKGYNVALISGGDPNIYGISNLALEYIAKKGLNLSVEIIPGISAFNAAAALLGAPLLDVAIINLSNLLIPWDEIKKRLVKALESGFILAIYNPSSKRRKGILKEAFKIIKELRYDCYVAIVKNAMRESQTIKILKVKDLNENDIDMSTIIIVGNEKTFKWKNYLITPRGYFEKYKIL